jgi:hypothetical protein
MFRHVASDHGTAEPVKQLNLKGKYNKQTSTIL